MFSQCFCNVLGCQVFWPTFSIFSAEEEERLFTDTHVASVALLDGPALVLHLCRQDHVAFVVKLREKKRSRLWQWWKGSALPTGITKGTSKSGTRQLTDARGFGKSFRLQANERSSSRDTASCFGRRRHNRTTRSRGSTPKSTLRC